MSRKPGQRKRPKVTGTTGRKKLDKAILCDHYGHDDEAKNMNLRRDTLDRVKMIIQKNNTGTSVINACREVGMSLVTYYKVINAYPEIVKFKELDKRAREQQLIDTWYSLSVKGKPFPDSAYNYLRLFYPNKYPAIKTLQAGEFSANGGDGIFLPEEVLQDPELAPLVRTLLKQVELRSHHQELPEPSCDVNGDEVKDAEVAVCDEEDEEGAI